MTSKANEFIFSELTILNLRVCALKKSTAKFPEAQADFVLFLGSFQYFLGALPVGDFGPVCNQLEKTLG
jgi:hypothetical protein